MQIENDDSKLINAASITAGDGSVQTGSDPTSQSLYGERDFSASWGVLASDALSRAQRLVKERKDPLLRIPALEIIWARPECRTIAIPIVDALEIGQRFTQRYQPYAPGSSEIIPDVIVEGVQIDSKPGEYHVTVQLAPADLQRYWLSGIAGFSESGVTTYSF
jgi:hypothetical protein